MLLISDIDSVLCQTAGRALRWVWDRYQISVPPSSIRRYNMEFAVAEHLRLAGIVRSPDEISEELRLACWENPAFFRDLEPRCEIWAALCCWQRAGLALQFQTRRVELLHNVTEAWLANHGLELHRPLAGGMKTLLMAADKATLTRSACEHYERVIFLEDAPHHALEIAEESTAEVWVVPQPWNQQPLVGCQRLEDEEIGRRLRQLARCDEIAA
ncbi:MAG: hypothetical protein JRH20_04665 [Deltaproteobacteria bacterium]|nr:hypothetical protein [Deltaproteobacteria bacterium]